MACNCENYINCNDPKIEAAIYNTDNAFSHKVSHTSMSDDVLDFYHKTERSFSVSYGWDRTIEPGYVVGCAGTGSTSSVQLICDKSNEALPIANCSEYCVRESNIPWYWDRQRGIYVWKHVREVLDFSITSDKTAAGIVTGKQIGRAHV